MTFIAFNLEDFHKHQDAGRTMVGVRFFQSKNLQTAKEFMSRFYPGNAWAVVAKKTFDQGIVYSQKEEGEE